MIEKILPLVLTVALIVTGLTFSGSEEIAVIPSSSVSDVAIMAQLMDYIGPDLVARGKEAGFELHTDIAYYVGPGGAEFTRLEINLRSAVGTAMYGDNTVDWQLMRDIQYAIIDANLFGLSAEDMAAAKENYYTPDSHYADIDLSNGINIHINESPFGYEALFYIRHFYTDFLDSYTRQWSCSYSWDELDYDSRQYAP